MRSMTGFAHAEAEENGWRLRVTLKALNHRFLDLRLRLPAELEPAEPRLRALVRERIRRGHLEVSFAAEAAARSAPAIDRGLLASYLEMFRSLQSEHKLAGDPDLGTLLRLPGVVQSAAASDPAQAEAVAATAEKILRQALERLDSMRAAEGEALAADLRARLAKIGECQQALEQLSARALPVFQKRLRARLEELLGQTQLNEVRLAEEAAYLAERSDIREELTRLASHTDQFAKLLAGGGEAGKRLDFLLQEMSRETNTILSKVPGLEAEGLEMTRLGLEIKADIERLREQVQNVE